MQLPTIPEAAYHSARIILDPQWRYIITQPVHDKLTQYATEHDAIPDLTWYGLKWRERSKYQRARRIVQQILDNHIIDNETPNMHRIPESKARELYNAGEELRVMPSMLVPSCSWFVQGAKISRASGQAFDEAVRQFRRGNCSSVNGYGVTFWKLEA